MPSDTSEVLRAFDALIQTHLSLGDSFNDAVAKAGSALATSIRSGKLRFKSDRHSNIDQAALIVELGLVERLPLRVILRVDPENGDQLQGYCEDSFSMSWRIHRVYVYWSGKAFSNLGTTADLNAEDDSRRAQLTLEHQGQVDAVVFDPLAENCPIVVDLQKWIAADNKFDKRNAPFTMKTNGMALFNAYVRSVP